MRHFCTVHIVIVKTFIESFYPIAVGPFRKGYAIGSAECMDKNPCRIQSWMSM